MEFASSQRYYQIDLISILVTNDELWENSMRPAAQILRPFGQLCAFLENDLLD